MTVEALEIDQLKAGEQEDAVRILVECFGTDLTDAAYGDVNATFADYPFVPVAFLARVDGTPCGFVQTVTAYFHKNTYSILWLAVIPAFRRRGIAAALIKSAEDFVIRDRFKHSDGSFLLVSEYQKEYYEKMGYIAGVPTHDGFPVMIKYYRS